MRDNEISSHEHFLACKQLREARQRTSTVRRRETVTCSLTSDLLPAGINAIDTRIDLGHQLETKRRGRDPPADETICKQGHSLIISEWVNPTVRYNSWQHERSQRLCKHQWFMWNITAKQNIRYRNIDQSSHGARSPVQIKHIFPSDFHGLSGRAMTVTSWSVDSSPLILARHAPAPRCNVTYFWSIDLWAAAYNTAI